MEKLLRCSCAWCVCCGGYGCCLVRVHGSVVAVPGVCAVAVWLWLHLCVHGSVVAVPWCVHGSAVAVPGVCAVAVWLCLVCAR